MPPKKAPKRRATATSNRVGQTLGKYRCPWCIDIAPFLRVPGRNGLVKHLIQHDGLSWQNCNVCGMKRDLIRHKSDLTNHKCGDGVVITTTHTPRTIMETAFLSIGISYQTFKNALPEHQRAG